MSLLIPCFLPKSHYNAMESTVKWFQYISQLPKGKMKKFISAFNPCKFLSNSNDISFKHIILPMTQVIDNIGSLLARNDSFHLKQDPDENLYHFSSHKPIQPICHEHFLCTNRNGESVHEQHFIFLIWNTTLPIAIRTQQEIYILYAL